MALNDEALPGRVYNSKMEESGVALKYAATTATTNPASENGLRLLQNQPNPFTDETTIGFVLPAGGGCDAQLRIFDATGRELWRNNKYYPAGYNAETVRLAPLAASGVLYYELMTPYEAAGRRAVFHDFFNLQKITNYEKDISINDSGLWPGKPCLQPTV